MAKNQRHTVEFNVTTQVAYYDQLGRLDWKLRQGKSGSFWEVKLGDTMLRTNDPKVLEIESTGGLDGIVLFTTSRQVVEGWTGAVCSPEYMTVGQYLHVRSPQDSDPQEATHQALLFETGVSFRSFEEIYMQD